MAFMRCMLLPVIVFSVATKVWADTEQKYEQLLETLVTTLSVQVADLTKSFSEMKYKLEKIEKENAKQSSTLRKMNRLFKREKEFTTALNDVKAGLKQTKSGMIDLQTSHAKTKEDVGDIKMEIANYAASFINITAKIDEVTTEVAVVSTEEKGGQEKCLKICAGTTGRGKTNWQNHSKYKWVHTWVDITSCGFTKIPTITASIEGEHKQWQTTGAIFRSTATNFQFYREYSNGDDPRGGDPTKWKWNVEWIAVGYTC